MSVFNLNEASGLSIRQENRQIMSMQIEFDETTQKLHFRRHLMDASTSLSVMVPCHVVAGTNTAVCELRRPDQRPL